MSTIDTSVTSHPSLEAFWRATQELTAPGAPFEVVEELVLGHRQRVFARRPTSLRAVLERSAIYGDRDCLVFSDGRRLSFEELPRCVASVAAYLRSQHGIGPGDRVAICAANDLGWLLGFWACASLGAVTVAMNGWWTELEMRHALELTEPALVLVDTKRAQRLDGVDGPPLVDLDVEIDAMVAFAPDADLATDPVDEDDPAVLIFTSGTTGRPKAAVLSHRCLIAMAMLQAFIGTRVGTLAGITSSGGPPPRRLAVFPLFHISGLGGTVSAVMGGGTTVWPLGRFDPKSVIALTLAEQVEIWSGTGTHVLRLLDEPDIDKIDPRQLRQVSMGGSATTPDIVRRTEERFPHLKNSMSSGYGSTETGGLVSWAPNWMLTAASDCVGPALPTVQLRVCDDDGVEVPEGEVGNIWVRSSLSMSGYWGYDETDEPTFEPGRWFRTGDFGRLEAGLLFIASRRRDLILRGGENIYPFEIENRLMEHESVAEVAVLGVDHAVLGQEVKAIVVPVEGAALDPDALRAFCAAALSSYKVPAHFEIRTTTLPRNASGKVMKHVLVDGAENTFIED